MVLPTADQSNNPRALSIEDDSRDAEGKVLEVLTHTDSCGGVVLQPVAVAHLGIEHLTGGEGLVTLDKVEQRDGFNREKIYSIILRFSFRKIMELCLLSKRQGKSVRIVFLILF